MQKVLFVCVHNSGRSQMAEAFFNRFAGTKARAFSAGTRPDDQIDPDVMKVMGEVGIDLAGKQPRLLTSEMLDQADRVITMGCGVEGVCPATYVPAEDWGLEDPKGQPLEKVRKIRDQIETKVKKLIEQM